MAVLSTLGLISTGTGFRSNAGASRQLALTLRPGPAHRHRTAATARVGLQEANRMAQKTISKPAIDTHHTSVRTTGTPNAYSGR